MVAQAPDGTALVEVGAWLGKSTAYLAGRIRESGKNITLHVVDTWRGSPGENKGDAARFAGPEKRAASPLFFRPDRESAVFADHRVSRQEKGTFYFSSSTTSGHVSSNSVSSDPDFFGRPRGRRLDSNPNSLAVFVIHGNVPYGESKTGHSAL